MKEKHGSKLKRLRNNKGLTRKELAGLLGVSENVIVNWEFGRTRIGADMLGKLSKILDFDIDDFLETKKPSEKHNVFLRNKKYTHDIEDIAQKFYELDDHGKTIVRLVLEQEYQRVKDAKDSYATIYPMFDVNTADNIVKSVNINYFPQAAGMGNGQDVDIAVPEKLGIRKDKIPENTDFIIRVVGDSMEPSFYSGDKLFVQKTSELNIGDIGVFNLNGEALVKEFGKGELISHNKKYKPIRELEGCYIQGRILGKYEED